MKTKQPASTKKPSVTVKDLKTRKNPKGGASVYGQQVTLTASRDSRKKF